MSKNIKMPLTIQRSILEDFPRALREENFIFKTSAELLEIEFNHSKNKRVYLACLASSDALKKFKKNNSVQQFYRELTNIYCTIYGEAPWNEFLVCSRTPKCVGKRSISDVHGQINKRDFSLRELERNKPTVPFEQQCPLCGAPMSFYYSEKKLVSMIEKDFSSEMVATFILNCDGRIEGFAWACFREAEEIGIRLSEQIGCSLHSEIVTTTKKYMKDNHWNRVLFFNEYAVSPRYRKTRCSILLVGELTFLGRERAKYLDIPDPHYLGMAMVGSSAHKFYERMGITTVYSHCDSPVAIVSKSLDETISQYNEIKKMIR